MINSGRNHLDKRERVNLLAADRVYRLVQSPALTVGSYPTLFTLTSAKSQSGIVSVALSLELPLVVVNNCPSVRCPDFPLINKDERLADNLTASLYHLS